jgi:hypothetical protein
MNEPTEKAVLARAKRNHARSNSPQPWDIAFVERGNKFGATPPSPLSDEQRMKLMEQALRELREEAI